jgi:hypothetical protein
MRNSSLTSMRGASFAGMINFPELYYSSQFFRLPILKGKLSDFFTVILIPINLCVFSEAVATVG